MEVSSSLAKPKVKNVKSIMMKLKNQLIRLLLQLMVLPQLVLTFLAYLILFLLSLVSLLYVLFSQLAEELEKQRTKIMSKYGISQADVSLPNAILHSVKSFTK